MYYIAQVNVGRLRAPLDDPLMADYMALRPTIDVLARRSPGFVWRRTGAGSDAKETDLYEDQMIIANVSVWTRLADYANFVYQSEHLEVLKRFDGPHHAIWWVPPGHFPTAEEARERLEHLRSHGETSYAFSFKKTFPAPDESTPTTTPMH